MDSFLYTFFTDDLFESMDMRLGRDGHPVVSDSMKEQDSIESNTSTTKQNIHHYDQSKTTMLSREREITLLCALRFQPLCEHVEDSIWIFIPKIISRGVHKDDLPTI